MISICILSQLTKSSKTTRLKATTLLNLFSSSPSSESTIPAQLLHKDWLSPPQVHQLFASLQNPKAIVSALNHYSKRKDYKPNASLFILVLQRLAAAHLLSDAESLFDRVVSQPPCRLSDDFFALAAAIFPPDKALHILLHMPDKYNCWPSSNTFNSVLAKLVSARMFPEAHEVFVSAPRLGVELDTCSFNVVLKGLCVCGSLEAAVQMLDEFPQRKSRPNSETFEILVPYFCGAGRVDEALGLVSRMEEGGIEPGTGPFVAVIKGLVAQSRVGEAMAVVEKMRREGIERGTEPYRVVFRGFVEEGRFVEASEVVKKAVWDGVVPSPEAFDGLIRGLCADSRVEDAGRMLEEMGNVGFVPDVGLWRVVVESLFDEKRIS